MSALLHATPAGPTLTGENIVLVVLCLLAVGAIFWLIYKFVEWLSNPWK